MPINVSCSCGASYQLKDELRGKSVKCPRCGAVSRAGDAAASAAAQDPRLDPVFARDKFLLNQKHFAIGEKYSVWDDQQRVLFFIERPSHVLRSLGALFAAMFAAAVVGGGLGAVTVGLPQNVQPIGGIVAGLAGIATLVVVAIALSPKRHVTFYRDESKSEPILKVLQDAKFAPITATYTVLDAQDQVLARLHKNYLYNIIRKRWYVLSADGARVVAMAMEDSLILSMLRRLLGPMLGILRTNFIICRGESEDVIGEFNRKFTLFDKYVLDLTADAQNHLDRRVAIALGVMLDTGEKR